MLVQVGKFQINCDQIAYTKKWSYNGLVTTLGVEFVGGTSVMLRGAEAKELDRILTKMAEQYKF